MTYFWYNNTTENCVEHKNWECCYAGKKRQLFKTADR